MPASDTALARLAVSVIVPARNEEASLGSCLVSLVAQRNVTQNHFPFEIIVVDDHSTDRTREIADSFSALGVRVVEAGPLPAGWTGKNNAIAAGVIMARGDSPLLSNARTLPSPGSRVRRGEGALPHAAGMAADSPRHVVK